MNKNTEVESTIQMQDLSYDDLSLDKWAEKMWQKSFETLMNF